MFSFFRRRPPAPPAIPTFNERVALFWKWFGEVAPRFYATIEAKQCASLGAETSAKVDELLPGLAWVYGPGANNQGHSLTLSGEGVIHRQLLAQHWLAQAPSLPGWTFYASRQASTIDGQVIEIDGLRVDAREIWVTPEIDTENEQLNLTVWHPLWEKIDERKRWTIVFLFLDETLGEYGTQWWVGNILFGKDRLAESFPLSELALFTQKISEERGWKKYPPGESWSVLRINVESGTFPRSDLFTLTTSVQRLHQDYLNAKGEMADPLENSGADYLYVSIDRHFFPEGSESARRGEIEEALDKALQASRSGRILGGGFGRERGYLDLLVFDGAKSLAIVQKTLAEFNLPRGTMIEYFARNKRAHRIAIGK